jgi:hypothetical protein
MSDTTAVPETFEHGASFEAGEVGGQVRVDRFEAYYESLFAEVIEDGVITPDERARLDKAAESLGLDRGRLRGLEQALQASYQARTRVAVREDEGDAPRDSLVPIESSNDPRVAPLQRRIKQLEARVAELELDLEEARASVHVEVDVSGVTGGASPSDPAELHKRLSHDPRDVEVHRALYRALVDAGDADRAFGSAQALAHLGAADAEQQARFDRHRLDGLLKPTSSVTPESWRRLLFHPDEELLTSEIFAVIAPAVLFGRVASLRHAHALPDLPADKRHDPRTSTVQAVRCFGWAAAILGLPTPPIYAVVDFEGLVSMVPGVPPSTLLGKRALSGRAPRELAFLAGRHLACFREEHFIRSLLPGIPDLEDVFLAALSIGNPGLPLHAEIKRRVVPIARAIEPILDTVQVYRLRGCFLRFVEEGGRTNLQRWAIAADRTSSRAGFLVSGDLDAAAAVLEVDDAAEAVVAVDDLLVFVTSDRYAKLRKQLGVAVDA